MIFGKDSFFYHETIRNYTAIFGYIFSDIHVKQDEQFKKVIIRQATGNLYENTEQSIESRDQTNVAMILPAMSYELVSFSRDDGRKLNRNHEISSTRYLNQESPETKSQLNRMPYNFNFDLVIRTKTQDEMFQIVEQIIGTFNPDVTFKVQDNLDLELEQDVVVRLEEDIQKEDNYDDYNSLQYKQWTLSFTLKGYMYRRSANNKIVTSITISALFGKEEVDDYEWSLTTTGEVETSEPIVKNKTTRRKNQNKPV
jgi:hypothetical protein